MQDTWTHVDQYFSDHLAPTDHALNQALIDSQAAGLPAIQVPPTMGKLLHIFAMMCQAKRVLEIGTLGGYSTIWLGRAVAPDGHVISLEVNPSHAGVARKNIERAGLSNHVDIRIGKALDTLQSLANENQPPFDLIFIDADKENNPNYLEWSLKLSRQGTVIICDNVVRNGDIVNAYNHTPSVVGTRRFLESMPNYPLTATAIQTVGIKGYDGFSIAIVNK